MLFSIHPFKHPFMYSCSDYFKRGYGKMMDKLGNKREKIVDIQKAVQVSNGGVVIFGWSKFACWVIGNKLSSCIEEKRILLPSNSWGQRKKSHPVCTSVTMDPHNVGQNNQEPTLQQGAARSSVRSFARTAHYFACSALLASLARSAALIRSLARSLRSRSRWWESEWLDGYLLGVFFSI